jgi:hypothetical protein
LARFKFQKSTPKGNYYLQRAVTRPDHSAEYFAEGRRALKSQAL